MNWKTFFAFAAIYVIWGSTYLAILIGIKDIPPFLMSGIRFFIAGFLLYAWCVLKRENKVTFLDWKRNSICGALLLFGGTVSVTWSEQYIPSSIAAIIVTAVPLWFVLLDKRQWKFYFSNKSIIAGLLIGLCGVIVLASLGKSETGGVPGINSQLPGILVIIGGGIAWATGSIYTKYYPGKSSLIMGATIQLISAGILCFVMSLVSGETKDFFFENVSFKAWMGLAYLVLMGSLVAYLSYLYLLTKKPPALVGSYVYVNPVVALLLGAFIAGEQITISKTVAMFLVLAGVMLVNMKKYKRSKTQ